MKIKGHENRVKELENKLEYESRILVRAEKFKTLKCIIFGLPHRDIFGKHQSCYFEFGFNECHDKV